jgi:HEAT repeat protein
MFSLGNEFEVFVMRGSFALVLLFALTSADLATAQPKADPKKDFILDGMKIGNKTFEQCLKEFKHGDVSKREAAIRFVLLFPPEFQVRAIPALVAELQKPQPTDLSVRTSVCTVLGEIFRANDKIDPNLQYQAATVLRRYLRDPQVVMRFRAAQALGTIGPHAKEAMPELVAMMKDQATWELRQAAAQALGMIAYDSKTGANVDVLRALYAELGDPAFQVRLAAIQSLTFLGPPPDQSGTKAYVDALRPVALKDPEVAMQIWGRCAIAHATSDFSAEMLGPITKLMADPDNIVRTQALQAMGTLGPKARTTMPGIIRCLSDADGMVKMTAIWAAGQMGDASQAAIPHLEKIVADPKEGDLPKQLAKQSLEKIRGK